MEKDGKLREFYTTQAYKRYELQEGMFLFSMFGQKPASFDVRSMREN